MKRIEYEVVGWAKRENPVFPIVQKPTKAMRRALVKNLRAGVNVLATDEYYATLNNGMQIHISQDMLFGLGEDVWGDSFEMVRKYGQFNPFHCGGEELVQARREVCSVILLKSGMASLKSAFSKGIRREIMPITTGKGVLDCKKLWFEEDVDSLYYWEDEDRIELEISGIKRVRICDKTAFDGTRFEGMEIVDALKLLNESYDVSKDTCSIKERDEVLLIDFEDKYEDVTFVSPELSEMSNAQHRYIDEVHHLNDLCVRSAVNALYGAEMAEGYDVDDLDETDYEARYACYKRILQLSRCRFGEHFGYCETNEHLEELADCCWHLGKIDEAFAYYRELIKYLPDYCEIMAGMRYYAVLSKLGLCYEKMGKQEEANKCFEQVSAWLKKMSIKEEDFDPWNIYKHRDKWDEMIGYCHDQQEKGDAYRDKEEYDKAIECYKTACDGFDMMAYVQDTRDLLCDMAWCYNLMGKLERAVELYDVALRQVDNTVRLKETVSCKEKEVFLAIYMVDVAMCYSDHDEDDIALKIFFDSAEVFEKYEGRGIPYSSQAWCYFGISQIYSVREDWKKEEFYATKSLNAWEERYSKEEPSIYVAYVYLLLAEALYEQGDYFRAIENNLEAIAIIKKQQDTEEHNKDMLEAYENLTKCYERQGDFESAKEYAQKAQVASNLNG